MYRLVVATQLCTLASTTGYRVYRLVLATQPGTLASTTGYRLQSVPAGTGYTALYTCLNNWLQVTECAGWYWLHSLVHLPQQLVTGYKVYRLVLATQPCTLASTTGYRLQSVPAGTGYTALYTCLNNWLQVTECAGWYWLHSLVHLLQQLVTKCTGWYWLHSLVHLLQPTGYKSTNRVLATQSLRNSASTQLVTYI